MQFRRALLLAGLLCAPLTLLADPPSEDVLRPDVPSQGGFYIEPHAGLNFTFFNGNPSARAPFSFAGPDNEAVEGEGEAGGTTVLDIYDGGSGIAPLIGVTFGYQFSPRAGIELDVAYDSRRASSSGMTNDACGHYDTTTGQLLEVVFEPASKDLTIGADYLSLALVGTFSLEKLFFFAGPSIGIPLSRTVEETSSWAGEGTSCRYFFGTEDETIEIVGALDEDVVAAVRASLRIGIGGRFAIGDRLELVPRLSYDLGLTDTFDGEGDYLLRAPNSDPLSGNYLGAEFNNAVRLSSLQASLGIRISL
jgi:hypothetical protein